MSVVSRTYLLNDKGTHNKHYVVGVVHYREGGVATWALHTAWGSVGRAFRKNNAQTFHNATSAHDAARKEVEKRKKRGYYITDPTTSVAEQLPPWWGPVTPHQTKPDNPVPIIKRNDATWNF
jgi:predicted DNA-binding WGR domain protein